MKDINNINNISNNNNIVQLPSLSRVKAAQTHLKYMGRNVGHASSLYIVIYRYIYYIDINLHEYIYTHIYTIVIVIYIPIVIDNSNSYTYIHTIYISVASSPDISPCEALPFGNGLRAKPLGVERSGVPGDRAHFRPQQSDWMGDRPPRIRWFTLSCLIFIYI